MTSLIEPIKIKKRQKIAQLIVSNIMYPGYIHKEFGEMDKIDSIRRF